MGIYIPGMEMPVGHNESSFGIDADGHPLLAVYTEKNTEPEIYYIIPVPDHGDLIDRDKAVQDLRMDYAYSAAKIVALQPTIIPADKEADT